MSHLNQHLNPKPWYTVRRLWNAGMTLEQIKADPRIARTSLSHAHIETYYANLTEVVGCRSLAFTELQNGIRGVNSRSPS